MQQSSDGKWSSGYINIESEAAKKFLLLSLLLHHVQQANNYYVNPNKYHRTSTIHTNSRISLLRWEFIMIWTCKNTVDDKHTLIDTSYDHGSMDRCRWVANSHLMIEDTTKVSLCVVISSSEIEWGMPLILVEMNDVCEKSMTELRRNPDRRWSHT